MDFFEHQDKARKNTKVLVVYFVIAVACIIASVYIASLLIFYGASAKQQPGVPPPELVLWDPKLFLYVVLGTLGVVIIGSLYKTAALAKGGSAVAEALGGRLVNPNTTHPDERKLRNLIEEMAIAAGVPVPKVYVLDDEKGINAFAAGHAPGDAAIGVTRGCMTLLNRDELQGVIGHEFSHILNGDMRLNLRIMGVIFGIVCLAVIGRILIYSRGGKDIKVVSPGYLRDQNIALADPRVEPLQAQGKTVVFVLVDGQLKGALALVRILFIVNGHSGDGEHSA